MNDLAFRTLDPLSLAFGLPIGALLLALWQSSRRPYWARLGISRAEWTTLQGVLDLTTHAAQVQFVRQVERHAAAASRDRWATAGRAVWRALRAS